MVKIGDKNNGIILSNNMERSQDMDTQPWPKLWIYYPKQPAENNQSCTSLTTCAAYYLPHARPSPFFYILQIFLTKLKPTRGGVLVSNNGIHVIEVFSNCTI